MAEHVTYTELLTEVDAAIAAVEKVDAVDPHVHLKPLVTELQRVRRGYAKRNGSAGIPVPGGKRAAVGID